MSNLKLSIAIGDYDRTRPIADGRVKNDGVDPPCSFLSPEEMFFRAFRHTSIYIRTDRGIKKPQDLKGKRIGIAEYQLSANVWVRGILEDGFGVKPSDIVWIRGGMDTVPPDYSSALI